MALTGDLLLSPLDYMNDPRENHQRGVVHMTVAGIDGAFGLGTDTSAVDTAAVEQRWREGRAQVRLSCFTLDGGAEEPWGSMQQDLRCFARARMWAQYGEDNAGVCLLFNRTQLERDAAAAFGEKVKAGWVRPTDFEKEALD